MRSYFFLLVIVLVGLGTTAGKAQDKVGIVNIDTILEQYYKMPKAKERIDFLRQEIQSEIKKEQDKGLSMLKEIEKMRKEAAQMKTTDPAVKAKMKEGFDLKVKEVRSFHQQLEEFKIKRAAQLQNEVTKMNNEILNEITEFVGNYGEKNGYDLVLNSNANSDILYVRKGDNLTPKIIQILNSKKDKK